MASISLNYNEITNISNKLSSCASRMETKLNEIKTQFNKIGNDNVWSGSSAAEAKATFDKLSAKFPEFSTAVTDCSKILAKVAENYKDFENSASKGVN